MLLNGREKENEANDQTLFFLSFASSSQGAKGAKGAKGAMTDKKKPVSRSAKAFLFFF